MQDEVYESLEKAYDDIQAFLISHKFGPEHSDLISLQDELSEILDDIDIQAIEKNSDNLTELHAQYAEINSASKEITKELNEIANYIKTAAKITGALDKLISTAKKIM